MIIYYSLKWDSIKDNQVIISKEPILDMRYYINEVNLRKSGILLKIFGKINHNSAEITKETDNFRLINNVPLLKSNLQKAVRRGDIDRAVVTGYNLIVKNFWEFKR